MSKGFGQTKNRKNRSFLVHFIGVDKQNNEHEIEERKFKIEIKPKRKCEESTPQKQTQSDAMRLTHIAMFDLWDKYPQFKNILAFLYQGRGQGTPIMILSALPTDETKPVVVDKDSHSKGLAVIPQDRREKIKGLGKIEMIKRLHD